MDALPSKRYTFLHHKVADNHLSERRFATFKLFYYDNTPADYEPPHFLPGDAVKNRWFFTTHGKEEAPEKWSLGGLETGYHG
jgi:hypothetical protein